MNGCTYIWIHQCSGDDVVKYDLSKHPPISLHTNAHEKLNAFNWITSNFLKNNWNFDQDYRYFMIKQQCTSFKPCQHKLYKPHFDNTTTKCGCSSLVLIH